MGELSVSLFGIPAGSAFSNPILWQCVFFFGLQVPLSCLRDISSLRFSSVVGILSVSYIVVLAVLYWLAPGFFGAYEGCFPESECIGNIDPIVLDAFSQLQALPTLLYALGCQYNLFLVSLLPPRIFTCVVASSGLFLHDICF